MPYFPGVGGRTYYQSWQPTRDVRSTVLVLHGYGEHLGLYEPLARWLTADGHAVYAVDALGHGRSDGERAVLPRFEDYVEDAWQVLSRRQQPGVPVTVIGHSGGAAAALLLALRHPRHVQALVLSGAAVAPWAWIEAVLASGVPETEPGDPTEFLSTHPDYVHALLHDPLSTRAVSGGSTCSAWRRPGRRSRSGWPRARLRSRPCS
ncbi:MAG: alpha/beta fold hydrolase [Actinomycetes bacterium]